MDEVWCVRVGLVPYGEARKAQKAVELARQADEIPDVLLLLEHPPVYTKGRRSDPAELPMGEDWYRMQGIEVTETDRGGLVTYHGPGQLVGYPIVDLKPYGGDVHDYIRRMERLMIDSIADFGVEAEVIEGLTGVWVGGRPPAGRKIGSIGVHVNKGVTTHGFAVNVNNDLQPFDWIVPCGIEGVQMTSLCRELGAEQDMGAYMDAVTARFTAIYERRGAVMTAGELAEMVSGTEALAAAKPWPSGEAGAASVR
ncbi:MAG: lipoyl(octanoyl) transferase LipB [Solirubrobacterales bacterium]